MLNPQCHLVGAFSLSSSISIDLSTWDLPQAGFWNYLREEITVGLACQRPVRIGIPFSQLRIIITCPSTTDDMRANVITYILARIMNIYSSADNATDSTLSYDLADDQPENWEMIQEELALWKEYLPSSFDAFSESPSLGNVFPSCWMFSPWNSKTTQVPFLNMYSPA